LTDQWPGERPAGDIRHRSKTRSRDLYEILAKSIAEKSKHRDQAITAFCRERLPVIRAIQSRFVALSDHLEKNIQDLSQASTDMTLISHLEPTANEVYPDNVNQMLLAGVKSSTSCVWDYHATPDLDVSSRYEWHSARLCLSSGVRVDEQLARFNIIVGTWDMAYWQEVALGVPK
jgi:hypothetical protein